MQKTTGNNKYLKILLVLLFLTVMCSFAGAQATVKWGDVDGNGATDIVDALMVARYFVVIITTLPVEQAADVDGNGQITIVDALLIAQYFVGIIQEFPVEKLPTATPSPTSSRTPGITGPYNSITPTPPGPKPSPVRTFTINTPFTVTYGESVALPQYGNLLIHFKEVSDSRCPDGAVCVVAGEAVVYLDIWTSGYLGELQLKAPPAETVYGTKSDPKTGYFYRLQCTAIEPYPVLNEPVPKIQYRVTLICMVAIA